MDPEIPLAVVQRDLLIFEDKSVKISENRQEDLIFQFRLDWMPVDIEEDGVRGTWPVLQDIQPPRIRRTRNPHMVWDDIEDMSHALRLERLDKGLILQLGPDFR